MFKQWKGDILSTTLKYQELRHVKLDGMKVTSQASYLKKLADRFRDIEEDKDGALFLVGDSGRLYKLTTR